MSQCWANTDRARGTAISASGNLKIRTPHGALIIGPAMGFPRLVRGAANGSGGMAGLAALRTAPDGFDAIRHWPRRFDLMPGASTASDGQIIGALERGIREQRVVMLYVADTPPPVMHNWNESVARRAPVMAPAGAVQTEAQKANAGVAAMSATDRVLAALEKGLRGLGDEFGELVDQFLEPENLLKVAGFLLATALVGLAANTNPISAAIFDGAMVAFVYYSAGRLGVESLMLLYEAIVSASNATTTAEIDIAGKDLSKAIIGLGGAVFLGWLARRLHLKAKARAQARRAPPPPEQLPPARVVPREGTQPPRKPYSNPKNRPAYAEGQVEEVWSNAQRNGKVFDPNTGDPLTWNRGTSRAGQWDMGHLPGQEYRTLHQRYMSGEIDLKQFLQEYRDPANYRPELPSANRSHLFEKK